MRPKRRNFLAGALSTGIVSLTPTHAIGEQATINYHDGIVLRERLRSWFYRNDACDTADCLQYTLAPSYACDGRHNRYALMLR